MSTALKQTGFVKNFVCLGDKCEDTCCKGWGMQVDAFTVAKYTKEAPELLEAVTTGEAEHIMKRDPQTDYCVKFDAGWCGIHRDRGPEFLGDACHFYPRITRSLGDAKVMSATLSCPEIVRQVMEENAAFELHDVDAGRLPNSLKDYLPAGMQPQDALVVHQAFVAAALDPSVSAERAFSRLATVSRSLESLPVTSWPGAIAFYLHNADARLPGPEPKSEDNFNLLHTLCGLVAAAKKTQRPRLMQVIADMESALHATLGWDHVTITLTPDSEPASQKLMEQYRDLWSISLQPVLRKWIATEFSMSLYPFSGFGETLTQRITTLGVRFAITRLALISRCAHPGGLMAEDTVRIVQSLSRFLDHLADPALLLNICAETGWLREARMRGLTRDI